MFQHPIHRRQYLKGIAAAAVSVCLSQLGCQENPNKKRPAVSDLLSKPRSSENSTALEFATVTIMPYRNRLVQEAWNQIDQQAIDLETRKQLNRNGIRAGIAGQVLPPALRSLLKPPVTDTSQLTDIQLEMYERGMLEPESVINSHTRITMLPNKSRDLPIVDARSELVWRWQDESGIQHHRLTDAVSMIRTTMTPISSNAVSIGFIPLLKHGKFQPQFNALDEQLAFQVGQTELLLSEARLNCQLRCGELLVLGPTSGLLNTNHDETNLGDVFFARQFPTPSQSLMLLRLLDSNTNEMSL